MRRVFSPEFTVGATDTGLAVAIVLGEEQLEDHPTARADPGGVGLDYHPVGGRLGARRYQRPGSLDLHQAQAARANGLDAFQVAQGRDLGAGLAAGAQQRGAFGHLDREAVNSKDGH
jgi:hypothetical protein